MTGSAEFGQGLSASTVSSCWRCLVARLETKRQDKTDMQVAGNSKRRCYYVSRLLFQCSIGSVAVPPVSCSFPTCTTPCSLPVQCLLPTQKTYRYIRRRWTDSSPHITLNPSFEYQAPADLPTTSLVCRAPTTSLSSLVTNIHLLL
jgi:hypothetical protein